MTDLVQRLRSVDWLYQDPSNGRGYFSDAPHDAADAIERLKGYVVHDDTCEDHGAYPGSCTCGLSRLRKEIGDG